MKQHGEAASVQGGARRIAMTIGRALQLIFLVEHAQWSLATPGEDAPGAIAAARRFAATPIDQLNDLPPEESQLLLR